MDIEKYARSEMKSSTGVKTEIISCTITKFRLKNATINEIKKIFKFSHEMIKEGILVEFLNNTINKAIKQKKATNLRMIKKG
jgi:hypothetical protein